MLPETLDAVAVGGGEEERARADAQGDDDRLRRVAPEDEEGVVLGDRVGDDEVDGRVPRRAGAWKTKPCNAGFTTTGTKTGCTSKAPMSVKPPKLRTKPGPRWSVLRLAGLLPWSIAGLPGSNASV
jgi:hypothetical protein